MSTRDGSIFFIFFFFVVVVEYLNWLGARNCGNKCDQLSTDLLVQLHDDGRNCCAPTGPASAWKNMDAPAAGGKQFNKVCTC